jgi:hypothetical protein
MWLSTLLLWLSLAPVPDTDNMCQHPGTGDWWDCDDLAEELNFDPCDPDGWAQYDVDDSEIPEECRTDACSDVNGPECDDAFGRTTEQQL